ncbi:uncharacterized protein LOC144653608 isoform X2 [Oculina patagonica]
MTEKTRIKTTLKREEEKTEKPNEELESITVVYNGKDHMVKFPNDADAKVICQSIKRATGVKGSFYVHFGEKTNNYLHCSSVTRGNLAKLAGQSLEVRGGNETNDHKTSVTFSLHPLGIQALRATTTQYAQL